MNSLRNKYSELDVSAKAALWFTFAQFFTKGISVLTTSILARLMITVEYGRANTFMSWFDILVIIISLSSWRGMLNLYKTRTNYDEILSSIVKLTCIIAGVFSVGLLLLFRPLSELMKVPPVLYFCLIFYAFSQNIIFAWFIRMQYEYKYRPIVIFSVVYSSITAIGGAVAVIFVKNCAEAKLLPQIITITIIALGIIVYYLRKFRCTENKDIWRFALSFSVPLIAHYLSEVVLNSSDRIMIDQMCGAADVAVYSIAYSYGSISLMITSAINSAFAPYQYQKIVNKEYATLAKNTNRIIALIAFCSCSLLMFGREIIMIIGGAKYTDGISIIAPITIGVFFNYVFQLFARVQEYYEQKNTIVIASVSCAVLNVILNAVFINLYGYKAAAYTTAFCYFAFCFLHYLFYMRACRKNIGHGIYDMKGLVLISLVFVVISCFIKFIDLVPIFKYLFLVVMIIVIIIKRKTIISIVHNVRR